MKTDAIKIVAAVAVSLMVSVMGCNRNTRTNPGQAEQDRAQTTREGGSTSVTGEAGKSENFGDTQTKTQKTGASPSTSPTGLSRDAEAGKAAPVTPQAPAEPTPK